MWVQIFPADLLSPSLTYLFLTPRAHQGPRSPRRPQRGSCLWMLLNIQAAHVTPHSHISAAYLSVHVWPCLHMTWLQLSMQLCASVLTWVTIIIYVSSWLCMSVGPCVWITVCVCAHMPEEYILNSTLKSHVALNRIWARWERNIKRTKEKKQGDGVNGER